METTKFEQYPANGSIGTISVPRDIVVVAAERERCELIMRHGDDLGLMRAAALLAFHSDMSVKDAKERLDELGAQSASIFEPRIVVDFALKNAPQGTTARVVPSDGVSATVHVG